MKNHFGTEIIMKKKNLKKTTACTVMMCAALCLGACGKNTTQTPGSDTVVSPVDDETQQQGIETTPENTEPADENGSQTNDLDSNANLNGSGESSVTVFMEKEENVELTIDDGTVYYTITCSYPVVSIVGNEAAAEQINADIRARVESFHTAAMQDAEWAKEDLEYMLSEDIQPPMPYSSDLFYTAARADDHVIAFTENSYVYLGGAHGMPSTIGINYDTDTGELITFTDLSDNPDAFRADTLAYNQTLAQTEYYSEQLFNTDDITNGTLEETLYADGMWYLSTSGLVFMSPPYMLAPYASGTLEFTIPYNELKDMGLKEQYAYTDRQIVKLRENETYGTDLNGDGNEDSVSYYDAWVDDETDSYEFLTHLTINGTDFSQDGTEGVREQLSSQGGIVGVMGVCLYDLDVNDNYVEVAVLSVDWIHNEDDNNPVANYYSHFFRYMEDGSLIYLGQAEGDVTDPTVSVAISDLQSDS